MSNRYYNPNNNESTPFLSPNHYPPTNRSDLNGSSSPSETHDIFVNALYSRLGPCLENNYNATPFNSHIVSHGWVNKTMTSSSSQPIGISMETIKKTCLQVIEQQRTNLNQFNSTNVLMTIKATYQLQNVHIHVLEHHYNNRFFFYLCIAHSNVPVRVCFGLLERCKNEMSPLLLKISSSPNVTSQDDTKQVSKILQTQLEFCRVKTNDKIVLVQSKIEDVKMIMISNIDKLIANMESTIELSQRTTDLTHDSTTFVYQARKTNNRMLCRVLMILAVLFVIVIVIIVFIILMVKFA